MTSTDGLVSVIIPCYNQGRFLQDAIESVLQQSYRQFEVIVVDDGSTDNTPEIVASYPEVHPIRHLNQGVSVARNSGVSVSSGRYLVFLDGDDRLLPHALEVGVKQMRNHADCAMAVGQYRAISATGTLLSTPEQPIVAKDHYRHLLMANYIHTPSTVMFRRSVFETVKGFDPLLTCVEDYDLYLRIARMFPIVGYDDIVSEYRRHDTNMTRNHTLMLRACFFALRKQRRYARARKEWDEAINIGMRTYRREWGERLLSQRGARSREDTVFKGSIQEVMMVMRFSLDSYPRRLVAKVARLCREVLSNGNPGRSDLK